jgi:hypothetical protein
MGAAKDLGVSDDSEEEKARKKRAEEYEAEGGASKALGMFKAGAKDWYEQGAGRILTGEAPDDPMENRKKYMGRK